eukprot:IDg1763t1
MHKRAAHISINTLQRMSKSGAALGLDKLGNLRDTNETCIDCCAGNNRRILTNYAQKSNESHCN